MRFFSAYLALSIAAAAALALASARPAAAAVDSSWNATPDWAPPDAPMAHRSSSRESRARSVAPFAPGSSNISIDVGQVFLIGDLARYDDSLGGQLHYTYGISNIFSFDCSAGYSSHSSGQFSMATLLPGIRLNLSWFDKVVPFAVLGMGFYRPAYQSAPLAPDASTPTTNGQVQASGDSAAPILFGVHFGAGVDLAVTQQLFFGASLVVHDAFGGTQISESGKSIAVGGAFASLLLHAGVTF